MSSAFLAKAPVIHRPELLHFRGVGCRFGGTAGRGRAGRTLRPIEGVASERGVTGRLTGIVRTCYLGGVARPSPRLAAANSYHKKTAPVIATLARRISPLRKKRLSMGKLSQEYPTQHSTASADFAEVERRAFSDVGQALGQMPGCGLEDLTQAAFSYALQSFNASGIPVREEWLRGKAAKWAGWWDCRHTASRTPRPHTDYTPAQALRGRVVSQYRRGTQADIAALIAQLAKLRGVKVSEIAGEIGKTTQHTRRLLTRTFSKLLVWIIGRTFGKGSVGFLPVNDTEKGQKEYLPNVRRGGPGDEGTPAHPLPLGNSIDLDDKPPPDFDQIREELGVLYPAWVADLAKLPG